MKLTLKTLMYATTAATTVVFCSPDPVVESKANMLEKSAVENVADTMMKSFTGIRDLYRDAASKLLGWNAFEASGAKPASTSTSTATAAAAGDKTASQGEAKQAHPASTHDAKSGAEALKPGASPTSSGTPAKAEKPTTGQKDQKANVGDLANKVADALGLASTGPNVPAKEKSGTTSAAEGTQMQSSKPEAASGATVAKKDVCADVLGDMKGAGDAKASLPHLNAKVDEPDSNKAAKKDASPCLCGEDKKAPDAAAGPLKTDKASKPSLSPKKAYKASKKGLKKDKKTLTKEGKGAKKAHKVEKKAMKPEWKKAKKDKRAMKKAHKHKHMSPEDAKKARAAWKARHADIIKRRKALKAQRRANKLAMAMKRAELAAKHAQMKQQRAHSKHDKHMHHHHGHPHATHH